MSGCSRMKRPMRGISQSVAKAKLEAMLTCSVRAGARNSPTNGAMETLEQAAAEVVLEDADLPAERGAGHPQLAGRFLEAEMAGRGSEGDEAVGRRQSEQSRTHKKILIEKKHFFQFTVAAAIGTLRANRDGREARKGPRHENSR